MQPENRRDGEQCRLIGIALFQCFDGTQRDARMSREGYIAKAEAALGLADNVRELVFKRESHGLRVKARARAAARRINKSLTPKVLKASYR